jgi:dihydrofolate reductase
MKNINTMKIMKKFLFLKICLLTLYSPTIFAITCSTGSGGSATYTWTEVRDSGDANGFPNRWNHSSVAFGGKLWVIAGSGFFGSEDDVWSSADGKTWTEVTKDSSKKFTARNNHRSVVFDGKMWAIGGTHGGNQNDVWSSTNGKTWTQVKPNNSDGFSARQDFTAVVFNDATGTGEKIYVIGGRDSSNTNDVWSSTNGKTWDEVTDNAAFSARQGHSSVNFDNKIWVIGGFDGSSPTNSVWSSANGKDWTEVTKDSSKKFTARNTHRSVVFDGKMWVIGGSGRKNDVWSSTNGKDWTEVTDNAGFDGRNQMSSAIFNNRVWILGGLGNTNFLNDAWSMVRD